MLRRMVKMLRRAKTLVRQPGSEQANVLARVKFPCC
ncbi:hypothetical protein SAMN05421757_106256 [Tropicimonas sediminicola]|uniref:Uncharacterized protein n=1 Tax=Tropicimonas sediminicola TaxID=1031541 RepID=A0A239K486_9RHOB|nr:hypothetical protein SAMN05421757_106256 [Tropicimonas sediminicola]